jgi:hypothetical protein
MTHTTDHNSPANQTIKGKLIEREVYCNMNSIVEFCLNSEDSNSPYKLDDFSNLFTYPEWSKTVIGTDLYFAGGTEDDKEDFLQRFEELEEESQQLLDDEEISEATHERNVQLIQEAKEEFEQATEESDMQEIFEYWAVSQWFAEKLSEQGEPVIIGSYGEPSIWGRTTTGQAISLDGIISSIAEGMEILEGQAHDWSK